MKKLLASFFFLMLFWGCESQEGEWDKLSQADRDYVQNRAITQCLADELATFENFRSSSELFFGSIDFPREKSYTSKLSDSSNNAIEERLIRIWKNTASYVIFYLEESIGTTTDKYFLKIDKTDSDTDHTNDTFGYNDSMIDELRQAYCRKTIDFTSGSTGPATASKTTSTGLSAGGRRETKTTQVYSFSEIPYWAFWKRSITLKDYDTADTVTTTKNYNSTLVENSNPPVLPPDYTTLSTKLCYVDPSSYRLPYSLKCDGTYTTEMIP